jgi:hypothetical protein
MPPSRLMRGPKRMKSPSSPRSQFDRLRLRIRDRREIVFDGLQDPEQCQQGLRRGALYHQSIVLPARDRVLPWKLELPGMRTAWLRPFLKIFTLRSAVTNHPPAKHMLSFGANVWTRAIAAGRPWPQALNMWVAHAVTAQFFAEGKLIATRRIPSHAYLGVGFSSGPIRPRRCSICDRAAVRPVVAPAGPPDAAVLGPASARAASALDVCTIASACWAGVC